MCQVASTLIDADVFDFQQQHIKFAGNENVPFDRNCVAVVCGNVNLSVPF
jgi:hypothetical protein